MRSPRIDFRCPCGRTIRLPLLHASRAAACPSCKAFLTPAAGAPGGKPLDRCLHCGSRALYTARDFPRRWGLGIVIAAAVLAPFTWYLSLAAAAVIDAVLFAVLGEATLCYACKAEHHGFPRNPELRPYDIHLAEALESRGGEGGGSHA